MAGIGWLMKKGTKCWAKWDFEREDSAIGEEGGGGGLEGCLAANDTFKDGCDHEHLM